MFELNTTTTRKSVTYNGETWYEWQGEWSGNHEFIPLGSLLHIPELGQFFSLPNMGDLNRDAGNGRKVQGFKRTTNQWFGLIQKTQFI